MNIKLQSPAYTLLASKPVEGSKGWHHILVLQPNGQGEFVVGVMSEHTMRPENGNYFLNAYYEDPTGALKDAVECFDNK